MGVRGLSRMGFVVQTSGLGITHTTVQGREGSVGPGSFCWGSRRVLGGCRWRGPRAEEQSNPAPCSVLVSFPAPGALPWADAQLWPLAMLCLVNASSRRLSLGTPRPGCCAGC